MIIIKPLTTYTTAVAQRVRELLIQLSRSGKDKGEIPESWFTEVIASPSHDLLLAYQLPDDADTDLALANCTPDKIVGIASLTLVMGAGIRKNIYLEDFVTDSAVRGQGVGSALWDAMLEWGRARGAHNLEFTCGAGRESAQAFYEAHGAEKYATNFYRKELGEENFQSDGQAANHQAH